MIESLKLRAATSGDLRGICALLAAESLPTEGVDEAIAHFRVFEDGDGVVAAAGVEPHGACALLRSLVVAPQLRGRGLAGRLVEAVLAEARAHGSSAVYLLTIDADRYFAGRGFEHVPRERAPKEIRECQEFRALCPDSAVLMRREI